MRKEAPAEERAAKNLELTCHGNFGPAKKLVRRTNIPGKMARADHFSLKTLVRDWNIGPSCINCMQRSQWGGSKLSLNALTSKGTKVSVVLSLQGLPWSC